MPQLVITGEILNVYRVPSWTNRQTGEVTPESNRVQILENEPYRDEQKYNLHTLRTESPKFYRENVGRTVTLTVKDLISADGQRIYYIPKNSADPHLS